MISVRYRRSALVLLIRVIAVLSLAVLVSALTIAPGFHCEKVLWMYIESAKPTVLAA